MSRVSADPAVEPAASAIGSLSSEEVGKVEQLKAAVADLVQGSPALKLFCTEATYVRYLRARNWDLHKATKMLRASLDWRLSYKPHEIRWEQVAAEGVTGKQYRLPFLDKEGRPVVVMRPRAENTKQAEQQIRYLVYNLESASRAADEAGTGKMTWLIDFEGYSMRNSPPLKVSIETLSILQNHYPERLGAAVCYHPPTLFQVTWKACQPFLDRVTYHKVNFVNKSESGEAVMRDRFDMALMEANFGGQNGEPPFVLEKWAEKMMAEDRQRELELQAAAASN